MKGKRTMGIVNINTQSEDIFEQQSFEPIPAGVYLFSLGNLPGSNVEAKKTFAVQTSSKGTPIVPVQLRCEANADGSETKYKGRLVFDNCALSHEVGQKKLVHMALAFGAISKEEISAAGGVDLERFSPMLRAKVEIGVKMEKPFNEPGGEAEPKNVVKRYLFE